MFFLKKKKKISIEEKNSSLEEAKSQKDLAFFNAYFYIIDLYANNQELKDLIPIENTMYYTSSTVQKTFNRLQGINGGAGERLAEKHIDLLRKRFMESNDQYNKGWNDCLNTLQIEMEKKIIK